MADITKLIEGYHQFYRDYFTTDDQLYKDLSVGQAPKTLIIACSDSRVDPSIVTSADPGDIFVIRNVANLVPPYEEASEGFHGVSAALEFAVCLLQVENIVVMGHSACAGIRALLDEEDTEKQGSSFIHNWVHIAHAAKQRALQAAGEPITQQRCCEQEGVKVSLKNLHSFPWVDERVKAGTLRLHGWYFSITDGLLHVLDETSGNFVPVPPAVDTAAKKQA